MKKETIFNKLLCELWNLEVVYIINRKFIYKLADNEVEVLLKNLEIQKKEIIKRKEVINKLMVSSGNSMYYLNKWNNYQHSICQFFDYNI